MVTEEEVISAATPQKNEIHNSAGHVVSSDQDGNTPAVPKKPSEDGYSWRKYGQKNVKRNEFIRSYYKCSFHSCQVKKQVEHAHDGQITDTTYFGEHDHPKPLNNLPITVPSVVSVKVQIADRCPSTIAEDKSSSALALKTEEGELTDTNKLAVVETSTDGRVLAPTPISETKDDDHGNDKLVLKRRKKSTDDAESVIDKHGSQSCHVVETVSVVDIVNDGYRWRKYGQKLVKGNLHPRSYYRCSNPGCPAKKRVERAFRDSKVVITTYEGKHDHEIPPVRTILPHGNSPSLCTPSEPNGAKKSNKRDLSVVVTEDDSSVSEKQQVDTSHHIAEEKKEVATTNPEVDAPTHDTHDSSGSGSGSGDQQTPDNMMVGSGDQTPDSMMVVSSCQESNPKERQNPDSEPVSC